MSQLGFWLLLFIENYFPIITCQCFVIRWILWKLFAEIIWTWCEQTFKYVFFPLQQSLLKAGWNVISSLNLLFTSVYESSSPCTPPKERCERDAVVSNIYSDSESPFPEYVFPPDGPEHSPTFTPRVQAHISVGSTSTPMPNAHINATHTSSDSKLMHSPSRIHSSSSLSLFHHRSKHSITDSPCSQERSWITAELSDKSQFEPKNLLSLFDEATLESKPWVVNATLIII